VNRQQRRAAEAQARKAAQSDKGFEDYKAQARRASPSISDRGLGEAWMRGQAFTASGAESMVIHEIGQAPQPPSSDDWLIMLTYESVSFKAFVPARLFDEGIANLEKYVIPMLHAKGVVDLRAEARQYLLDMLVENKGITDGNIAALMAATVGWLVKSSDIGQFITRDNLPRTLHYNITTFMVDGRRAVNFRLLLGIGHDGTIPDWVKAMPPTSRPGEPGPAFAFNRADDENDMGGSK
jgi:hypothetical protein